MKPELTIGIPAWQAEAFLSSTVNSAQAQTVESVRILISVDESEDNTGELSRSMAVEDERIEVIEHGHRLGWIGNMNALIDRIETDYFVLLPHDDRLSPDYVEKLLPVARGDNVALAYSDITLEMAEGSRSFEADLPQGPAVERIAQFLMGRPNGVAMRGVTRTAPVQARRVRLRDNRHNGFLAGTTYVLELLSLGLAVRLPEPLYTKWVRSESVHESIWKSWPFDRQMDAWVEHTVSCLDAIASLGLTSANEDFLASMALDRLKRLALPGGHLHHPDADEFETQIVLVGLLAARLGRALSEAAVDGPFAGLIATSRAKTRYAEAIALRDRGWSEAAAGLLGEVVELDDRFAEAHLQRAAVLFDLDQYEAGLVSACEAVSLLPQDPRAHLLHSRLLAACGHLPEALRAAELARGIAPDHPHLDQHLNWLANEEADRSSVPVRPDSDSTSHHASKGGLAEHLARWGTRWQLRPSSWDDDTSSRQ